MTSRFSAGLSERLTSDVTAGLPPGMAATLANPQAMMNPQVAAQIRSLDPAVIARMQPLMRAVKGALGASLHDVFLTGTFVALGGLVFALLLVDVPLRKTNRQPQPAAEVA